jgi:PAS domain S-box-containing protein
VAVGAGLVWWGPDLVQVPNDAARSVFGARADPLGRSARDAFADVWDRIGPQLERARKQGAATFDVAIPEGGERRGAEPTTRLSISLSALRNETGEFAGVFVGAAEADRPALKAARESEERLNAAVASMSDAVLISDAEGRFTHINQAFATFHKFSAKGKCPKTLAEYPVFLEVFMANGETAPLDQWAVPRALRGETGAFVEYRLRRKDTGESWIGSYCFAPIWSRNGQIVGSVVTARDVTDIKRTRAELQLERDKLKAIVDAIDAAVCIYDRDGAPRSINAAAVRLFGFASQQDALSALFDRERLFELRYPDGATIPFNQWPLARLLRGETVRDFDAVVTRGDEGRQLHVRFDAASIRGEYGATTLHVISITDLTPLRLSEIALRKSELRLRSILDSAADAIVLIDEAGDIHSVNPATEKMFGYSASEMIGRNMSMLVPEKYARGYDGYFARLLRKGRRKVFEVGREIEGRRKDGASFPVDLAVAEWQGDRRLFTGIMRDITERKRVEEQLAASRRMEAVGQLAGGVAHDFNNLLAVIAGNLEIAEPRITEPSVRRLIQAALDAAEAGASFNQRLLSLARKRDLQPVLLNVNSRVIEMAGLVRHTLGAHIALKLSLAPDLWETRTDRGEVDSALLNLAGNSRDAMPDGGTLTIETRNATLEAEARLLHPQAEPGDYVALAVVDTGIGMTPEQLKRATEPFFTTKEPGKGTGLGLSSVASFARQSGGFVTITSEIGKGTCVVFYLPRSSAEAGVVEASSNGEAPLGDGETVLVVEDDDRVREVTLRRLESLGYAVCQARSGPQAIELLKRGEAPDVVLSDIVMPGGMTGYDVARWIFSEKPGVKVVLTSGYNPGDRARDDRGLVPSLAVLAKPFTRTQLAQAIRSAIEGTSGQTLETSPVNT